MGSTYSKEAREFKFVQIVKDRNFGTVKVYRELEKPYDYYMKLLVEVNQN